MNRVFKLTLGFLLFTTLAYADFTPPVAPYDDPPDSYTKLQCSFDEADTSTTTDDESAGNYTITNNGNVQTDSGITKFSNTSLFDGTGDYWSIPDSDDWNYGTGLWTIDFWIRISTIQPARFYSQYVDASNWHEFYHSSAEGIIAMSVAKVGAEIYAYKAWSPSVDTWYHIAYVRYGTAQNNLYIYIDGVSQTVSWSGTMVADYSFQDLAAGLNIGGRGASSNFFGSMEEYRVSKGIARDWITTSGKQFIWITKFINNLNPDKIGTPMWSCKIRTMGWWKNLTWKYGRNHTG